MHAASPAFFALAARNLLFTLIMLHQLDGTIIWVESAHLQIIKDKAGCEGRGGSTLRVGGGTFCVKETADQIRELLKSNK
jgi:hypothetical protein